MRIPNLIDGPVLRASRTGGVDGLALAEADRQARISRGFPAAVELSILHGSLFTSEFESEVRWLADALEAGRQIEFSEAANDFYI